MNRLKAKSVSIEPVKFDSIPEDVALVIAAEVEGFAAVEGTLEEKEKARKERDSTLWSAALSCRANFSLYFPQLLQNVTLDSFQALLFYHWLMSGGDGSQVRSLCIQNGIGLRNEEIFISIIMDASGLSSDALPGEKLEIGILRVIDTLYAKLPKIETLHIQFPTFIFTFRSRPHSFINSLKKLCILKITESYQNLTGRNVLWILLFVPKLEEAALSFELSVHDFKVLVESADWFKGLSNVKKLAVAFTAIYDKEDRKTWWGLPEEMSQMWEGGSKKSTAILNLLRCTKKLLSFELSSDQEQLIPQHTSPLFSSSLLGLAMSFNSLQHLRVMNMAIDDESLASTSYSEFKALRILTVDGDTLYDFCSHEDLKFPRSLEAVGLVYYKYRDRPQEDRLLASFIQSRSSSLPRLKEVVVPLNFMQANREDIKPEDQGPWKNDRESLEYVTSGKGLQLRKVKQGEEVGDDLKGEVFLSTVLWVSN